MYDTGRWTPVATRDTCGAARALTEGFRNCFSLASLAGPRYENGYTGGARLRVRMAPFLTFPAQQNVSCGRTALRPTKLAVPSSTPRGLVASFHGERHVKRWPTADEPLLCESPQSGRRTFTRVRRSKGNPGRDGPEDRMQRPKLRLWAEGVGVVGSDCEPDTASSCSAQ